MNRLMTRERLRKENLVYRGTGGVSAGNRQLGFIPAFCDTATGEVELSRLPDGNPAPMHLLEGLPEKWIVERVNANQVLAVKPTVIAGFLHAGVFYTRAQAARAGANSRSYRQIPLLRRRHRNARWACASHQRNEKPILFADPPGAALYHYYDEGGSVPRVIRSPKSLDRSASRTTDAKRHEDIMITPYRNALGAEATSACRAAPKEIVWTSR